MKYDLEGARKAGFKDPEIAEALASRMKYDRAAALKAGVSDSEMIDAMMRRMQSSEESVPSEPTEYDETKPPAFGGPPRSVYENIQAGAREATGSRILPDPAKLLRPGATPEEQLSEILHYRPTPERFLARVPAVVGYGARKIFGEGEPAPLDEVLARYPNVPSGVGAFIPPVPPLLPFRNKLQQRDLARAQQKVLPDKKTTPGRILTDPAGTAELGAYFIKKVFPAILMEGAANELFKQIGIPAPQTEKGEPPPETIIKMGKEFIAPYTESAKKLSGKPFLEHAFDNPENAIIEILGPLAAVLGFKAGAKSRKAGKRAAEEAKLRQGDAEVYREGPTPETPPEAPAYTRVPPEQRRTKVPAEPGFGPEFTRRSQPQPAGPFQPWEAGMRPVEPALPVPQRALPPAREAPSPGLPSGPEPPLQLQAGPRAPAELLPGQPFTRRPISPEASGPFMPWEPGTGPARARGLLPPAAPAELLPALGKPKAKAKAPPGKGVQLPEFRNTQEAFAYNEKLTEQTRAALEARAAMHDSAARELQGQGMFQEAMDTAVKAQLDREALRGPSGYSKPPGIARMEVPRDQKGKVGLEREVGEGQAPRGAVPVQGAGPQAAPAGGVPQEPKGREVAAREPQRPVAAPREVQPGMEPAGKAVVREKAKPAPKAKEPWEMTREEWIAHAEQGKLHKAKEGLVPSGQGRTKTRFRLGVESGYPHQDIAHFYLSLRTNRDGTRAPGMGSLAHMEYLRDALSEGKPVPPEVLADYPDLSKPAPAVPPKPVEAKEKPKKGKLAAKLTEEKGAISLPKKRTDVEKRFENAYKRMKNAKPADSKPAAVRAAAQSANMKPEAQEPFARAVEMEAEGKPFKEVLKAAGEAIEADLFTPVKTSLLSKASVAYIKTRDFSKMIDEMPEAGPLKGADALEDAGRLKKADYRGQPGIASLPPARGATARAIKEGKGWPKDEPGVRESGFYVHENFTRDTANLKDIDKNMGETMPIEVWAEMFDGPTNGPMRTHVVNPAFDTIRARMAWQSEMKTKLQDLAEKYNGFSKKAQEQVYLYKNGQLDPAKVPDNIKKLSDELGPLTDLVLEHQNAARVRRGQEPIPRLDNWVHWVAEQRIRDSVLGKRTTAKDVMSRPGYYDTIQPNRLFNPMEKHRALKFEAYKKDTRILRVLNDVIDIASRDIFNTNIIENNKVHAKALERAGKANASNSLMDWTSRVFAGQKHPTDVAVSKLGAYGEVPAGLQMWLKNRLMETIFPLNFRWAMKTQWTSLNLLAARVGYANQVRGLRVFTDPKLNKIVKDTYAYVMKSGTAVAPEIAAFRETVADFPKLSQPGAWSTTAQKANFLMKAHEEILVRHAVASGYFKGKQMGLKGRDLLEYASDTGARAHSMYNMENLPGVLHSKILKSSFPLQTFSFEAMNHLRQLAAGKGAFYGRSPATRFFDFSKMVAQIYATNALTDYLLGAHAWGPLSFVPYGSIVSSAAGLSTDRYKFADDRHLPTIVRFTRNTIRAGVDVYEGQPAFKTLRTYFNRNFMIGGQPIETTLQGIEAAQRGAVLDRAGKVQYRVKGDEALKAIVWGPRSTEGGQKYIEKQEDDDKTLVEKLLGAKSSKKKRRSSGTKPTGGTSGTKPTGG